jgi:hypothetical protein
MDDRERALDEVLKDTTRQCQKLGYYPAYAVRMIAESGPLGACRRLLDKPEVSQGFTRMWELKRLDITVEAIALRPELAPLFTNEELAVARERLEKVVYAVP